MKNIFSLALVMTVTLGAFAQAPQGFNYQAVVLNSSGGALSNQTVSLQLSILDSSASGVAVYVETQNPTTDTAGLFSVVIGNGTVVSGNFSTINWGKNYKFLKTEIDTAGGSNYVLMGISQMMSVPYALYANQTKQTFSDINYPDGLEKLNPVIITYNPFIVPAGKNLYLPPDVYFVHGTDTIFIGGSGSHPTGFSEGDIVRTQNMTDTSRGWLVNKTVDWLTTDIVTNPITVPIGKVFVIVYLTRNPSSFGGNYPTITCDGVNYNYYTYFKNSIIFPGQTLSAQLQTGYPGQLIVNGYFRDE